jgi:hypothetical protein
LASNSGAITFTSNVFAADVVEIVSVTPQLSVLVADSNTRTTNTTSNTTVDSFSAANYRSAKYYVQITSGTDYHVTEVLLIHDGTEVYITEYGTVYSNTSLGNVSANINTGYVELLVAPSNSTSTVKTRRLAIEV